MAVLPEAKTSLTEITIDDIKVGGPGISLSKDQEDLRQMIWKIRHLLIVKGNALPPEACGAVCDIDVEEARQNSQRARPVYQNFLKSWLI